MPNILHPHPLSKAKNQLFNAPGRPGLLRDRGRAPRQRGKSPRQQGQSPRQRGESPRQTDTAPRQQAAAARVLAEAQQALPLIPAPGSGPERPLKTWRPYVPGYKPAAAAYLAAWGNRLIREARYPVPYIGPWTAPTRWIKGPRQWTRAELEAQDKARRDAERAEILAAIRKIGTLPPIRQ